MRTGVLIVCLSFLLGGCAHVRPTTQACAIKAYPIRSSLSDPVAKAYAALAVSESAQDRPTFYDQKLARALGEGGSGGKSGGDRSSFLVLSGGSQNGAFGGGLLFGLKDPTVYDAVTGVSTGAPQATLAFLSGAEGADDRAEPDDQGDRRYRMKQSNLEDLAVALSISRESTLLDKHPAGIFGAVTAGSAGSLAPLKERLFGFASEKTLEAVGRQHQKRLLMVGVTNLDDGYGYALDLTELASRILKEGADKRAIRECYVDALIASSAVPIFAQPVMLNVSVGGGEARSHLFIDGGARHGVFLPPKPAGGEKGTIKAPDVTMIVNGPLYSNSWMDKRGRTMDKWTALDLVGRSVEVMINQVYRFSVDDVARFARDNGGTFRMAYISNEGLAHHKELPDDHVYDKQTCSAWREHDEKADPLEFHPRYMACLLDYGVERGRHDPWNYTKQAAPKAAP